VRRVSIVQGESAVIAEPDVVITTLLGSCIAVCLHDAEKRVGGMNHFLLGEPDPAHNIRAQDMHRYGVHAMELLINAMMHKGAVRSRLRAHVYGGANIISTFSAIGTANGEFALRFLRTEGIPIAHCDIGGNAARKVEFIPWDGKSRCTAVAQTPPPVAPPRIPAQRISDGDVELFS
jgi:chemotaxis protein CheD